MKDKETRKREKREFRDVLTSIAMTALLVFFVGCLFGYRVTMLSMELDVMSDGHTIIADVFGFQDVYYIE